MILRITEPSLLEWERKQSMFTGHSRYFYHQSPRRNVWTSFPRPSWLKFCTEQTRNGRNVQTQHEWLRLLLQLRENFSTKTFFGRFVAAAVTKFRLLFPDVTSCRFVCIMLALFTHHWMFSLDDDAREISCCCAELKFDTSLSGCLVTVYSIRNWRDRELWTI